MFGEEKEYPWKLRQEDLAAISQPGLKTSLPEPASSLPVVQWIAFAACFVFGLVWLVIQGFMLNPGYNVSFNPKELPGTNTASLEIVPSPIRYDLLVAQPSERQAEPKTEPVKKFENGFVPVNFTSAGLPPDIGTSPLPPPISLTPPPKTEPVFTLIGIAQGSDGTVATLKTGDMPEGRDVREGDTLVGGYMVSKITADYVLLKSKKEGKTLRVE